MFSSGLCVFVSNRLPYKLENDSFSSPRLTSFPVASNQMKETKLKKKCQQTTSMLLGALLKDDSTHNNT